MNGAAGRQWYVYAKKADFAKTASLFGVDPVIARILRNRDLTEEKDIRMFLKGGIPDLYDEKLLPDAETGALLAERKIREGKKIRIVGDYDIDGVCATCILYDGLKKLGADVDYRIPERIRDGYGINMRIVEEAIRDGVDTLITCDNGISAFEELRKAKDSGLTVILTDHHEIRTDEEGRELLPAADCVISAGRKGSAYPEAEICGAVTSWKFLHLLYRRFGREESEWLSYLEFAGIATIGDVMKLTGENRIIAREALKAMNKNVENRGLQALIRECGLEGKRISCTHIGFVLGPCINAGGRLETAEKAMQLLLAKDTTEAAAAAKELKELNDSRKDLTQKGVEEAIRIVQDSDKLDKILVVYLESLHESMAGIVAGRLKEFFGRPAIVLTASESFAEADGAQIPVLKGSGRSVEAWNMYEGLKKAEDLMLRFGGHPMAAGLSIRKDRLEEFRKRLNDTCGLTEEELIQKIWIDLPMPLSYISQDLIRQIDDLEPFGNGNPKPLFAEKNIRPANLKVKGPNRNVLKMNLYTSDGFCGNGIMFGEADRLKKELENRRTVNITYHPQINSYLGQETIQIQIEDYI